MSGVWKCNARLLVAQVQAQRTGAVIGQEPSTGRPCAGRAGTARCLGVAVSVADQGVQHEVAGEDGKNGIELGCSEKRPGPAGTRSTCLQNATVQRAPGGARLVLGIVS